MDGTLMQATGHSMCGHKVATINRSQLFHNDPRREQRREEMDSCHRPVPHGATTQCACLSKNGSEVFLWWKMIHAFNSFLATGRHSAGCNLRIHLLCYEGAGNRESTRTSWCKVELAVWFEDEKTKPAKGEPPSAFLSSDTLGRNFVLTAAAAGFLLLN